MSLFAQAARWKKDYLEASLKGGERISNENKDASYTES